MTSHPEKAGSPTDPPQQKAIDNQSKPSRLEQFSSFHKLPTELRLVIWEEAINDPHLILICDYNETCLAPAVRPYCGKLPTRCKHNNTFPGVLLACQESRSVALSHFLNEDGRTPRLAHDDVYISAFNPRCDILFIDINLSCTLPEVFEALEYPKHVWFPFRESETFEAQGFFDMWDILSRRKSLAFRTLVKNQWCWLDRFLWEAGSDIKALETCTMGVPQLMRWHHPSRGNGPLQFTYDEFEILDKEGEGFLEIDQGALDSMETNDENWDWDDFEENSMFVVYEDMDPSMIEYELYGDDN